MLEAEQVQGNVLYAYGTTFRYARYVMVEFKDRIEALDALRRWRPHITFGEPLAPRNPGCHVNVAFTSPGLEVLLERDKEWLLSFPEDFQEGARKRSDRMGDSGESHADKWWHGKSEAQHHALVVVHAKGQRARDDLVGKLLGDLERPWDTSAALLERDPPGDPDGKDSCSTDFSREHFGFADGCSQPAIEGVHDDPVGGGLYARLRFGWWPAFRWLELLTEDLGIRKVPRRWRGIRAGEFVLGYESEDGDLPKGPPAPLGPNGTFMVYRELEQHVDVFKNFVREAAKQIQKATAPDQAQQDKARRGESAEPEIALEGIEERLRAKIVGRWPDGTPLALSPDSDDELIATNRRRANNFLYREDRAGYRPDPEGLRCPLGAHVRRTNPRDALPGGAERTMRHRIIRRGMPYGEPYDERREESSSASERGLAFVCFSSSIANGFEFIQREWCDGGGAFGLGGDRDLLLQQRRSDDPPLTGMAIPARDGKTIFLESPTDPFVTVRGCDYLFLPSRRAYNG